MKKLIIIIILLIAVQVSAQDYKVIERPDNYANLIDTRIVNCQTDTIKVFYKFENFGVLGKDVKYKCTIIQTDSKIDTVCRVIERGSSQGFSQTDTLEIITELQNVQKLYKETYEKKVKELETNDADLLRMQGIIIYLNSKLEAERKKK